MPYHPPLKILAPGAPLVTQEAKNGLRMGSEPPVPLCYAATFLANGHASKIGSKKIFGGF